MKNDDLNKFLTATNSMIELWMVIFNGFKAQGLCDDNALKHTKEFMYVAMTAKGENNDI